jgi:predicted GIY-YIG superfamily endonuclease
VDTEGAFVPHKPDPELWGTAIVYAVRLDYFGKLSKGDQKRLVEANPQANKKAPVFYVGQTTLDAWQRYENHCNGHWDSRWVKKYGQHLIRVDEWEPDFGVALPKKTIKAAWELARRSKADPIEREKAVAELLREQGYYVISH